ncbi:MAG: carbohydrate ABC transporter permease, partial [Ruthenibacterium sp.]
MNAKQRHKIRRITSEVLFWLLALVVIVPFLIVLFNAFKTKSEAVTMALTPPTTLHWENFAKVWEDGAILRSYGNSLYISIGSVLLSVMMSAMCAFVLSRNRSRFNKGLYLYFSLGLMFPLSMVTVVKVMRMLHLYGTLTGVVLLFAALLIPLSIFLFYGFVNGIPIELDEAAIVDGAG